MARWSRLHLFSLSRWQGVCRSQPAGTVFQPVIVRVIDSSNPPHDVLGASVLFQSYVGRLPKNQPIVWTGEAGISQPGMPSDSRQVAGHGAIGHQWAGELSAFDERDLWKCCGGWFAHCRNDPPTVCGAAVGAVRDYLVWVGHSCPTNIGCPVQALLGRACSSLTEPLANVERHFPPRRGD